MKTFVRSTIVTVAVLALCFYPTQLNEIQTVVAGVASNVVVGIGYQIKEYYKNKEGE